MAGFNYTSAPTVADKVSLTRLWLGDRDKDNPLFNDTEIEVVLSVQPSPVQAAASLALARAATVARRVDKTIGKTRLSLSQEMQQWLDLAARLNSAGAGDVPNQSNGVGGIRVAGITIAEKKELRTNNTNQPFSFEIGMDDHQGTDAYVDNPEGE